MEWTIEYNSDKHYIRVDSSGKFNHKDHRQKMEEIVSKDYLKPGVGILFDCTEVDFSDIDLKDIRKVVSAYANNKELNEPRKIAMLMKSSADFGRGRQFEIISEDQIRADVGIFLDEIQSLDWLET